MTNRILRLPEVQERIGLSRSSIYLRISEGKFPKPISLGGRAVGWHSDELNSWLDEQTKIRDEVYLSGRRK